MRLLKTHFHTSSRLDMEPGTREDKQLKKTRKKRKPYNKAKVTHQNPAVCRRCGGGGAEKALDKLIGRELVALSSLPGTPPAQRSSPARYLRQTDAGVLSSGWRRRGYQLGDQGLDTGGSLPRRCHRVRLRPGNACSDDTDQLPNFPEY